MKLDIERLRAEGDRIQRRVDLAFRFQFWCSAAFALLMFAFAMRDRDLSYALMSFSFAAMTFSSVLGYRATLHTRSMRDSAWKMMIDARNVLDRLDEDAKDYRQ